MSNKPELQSLSASYFQEADAITKSNADWQHLEITSMDAGAGTYFYIKTEGWAFDSIQELVNLLEDFKKKLDVE